MIQRGVEGTTNVTSPHHWTSRLTTRTERALYTAKLTGRLPQASKQATCAARRRAHRHTAGLDGVAAGRATHAHLCIPPPSLPPSVPPRFRGEIDSLILDRRRSSTAVEMRGFALGNRRRCRRRRGRDHCSHVCPRGFVGRSVMVWGSPMSGVKEVITCIRQTPQ